MSTLPSLQKLKRHFKIKLASPFSGKTRPPLSATVFIPRELKNSTVSRAENWLKAE
jgi:hypothetical protein